MKGVPVIFSVLAFIIASVDAGSWVPSFDISSGQKYIENIHLSFSAINDSDTPAWVDEWKAPKSFQKLFPFYISGHDFEGSPVYVMEFGNWKVAEAIRSSKDGPEKAFDLFVKYTDQIAHRIYRDSMANKGQGLVFIMDYDGFAIPNYASPLALQAGLTQLATLNRLYETLNYAFFINMNFVSENMMQLARPLLGNVLDKCEIFGSQKYRWLPHLARKIPTHQLPPSYGGPKDWQPLTIGLEPFNSTNTRTT